MHCIIIKRTMAEEHFLLENLLDLCEQGNSSLKIAINIIKRKHKRFSVLLKETRVLKRIPKTKGFVETVDEMPDDVFYSHFRMGRKTFDKLLCLLNVSDKKAQTGRPGLELKNILFITLWKLSNQDSFREVSDRFNVGMGACYRGFVDCVHLIANQKQLIKFPNSESSRRKIMEGFESFRSHPFPYVLGCIDGTHIRISQPTNDSVSYYNRKGTYSIIVQAVADSEYRFLDVLVGHPGRCHDASVWATSPLKRAIASGLIAFPSNCHLLGDAAYPLENYLMVPYRDNGYLSAEQIRFNTILSSTRVCVEQAFGILKKKFRILNYLEVRDVKLAKTIIMSCFIVHSFIINTDGSPENVEIFHEIDSVNYSNNIPNHETPREQARMKKKMLTTLLSA